MILLALDANLEQIPFLAPLPLFPQVTQKEVVGALQQLAADGHVSYNERSQTVIARGA